MAAGDIVQSAGVASGGSTVTSQAFTLSSTVAAGNTVFVAMSCNSVPTSVPSGFSLVGNLSGNLIYASTTATGTSWTFGWGSQTAVAGVVVEFSGTGTFGTPVSADSPSPSTSAAFPSVTAGAGDRVLAVLFAGYQASAPGQATAWTNSYSTIVNSAATTIGGGFNFRASAASRAVTSSGSYTTTATISATTYWTAAQVAASFTGGGGTDASVTAVPATGTAAAVAPAVKAGARAVAVAAAVSLAALAPQVSGQTVVSGGGPATASVQALAPTVSASQAGTVTAPTAVGSADAVAPTVTASARIAAAATRGQRQPYHPPCRPSGR